MSKFKLILFALLTWTSYVEAKEVSKKTILGLWRLIDFTIISPSGIEKKWANEVHGTLIYTPTNFMSVSINGKRSEEYVNLFYSGKYIVCKRNIIKHRVDNASDPNRINQIMIREANYSYGVLTLIAQGSYGKAIIKWEKYNLSLFDHDQFAV